SWGDLEKALWVEEIAAKLCEFPGADPSSPPSPLVLARFRRRVLLRILLRDVLGMATLSDVTEELSNLSDALLEFAYNGIRRELMARHGVPLYVDAGGGARGRGFSAISPAQVGRRGANYSSGSGPMFGYTAPGYTRCP